MRVHGLEITASQWAALLENVEARYPEEGCGIGLARPGATRLARLVPVPNVAPGDRRRTFALDDAARLRALMAAPDEVERLVFHAHCDAPAYWSPSDAAGALVDGAPRVPGAVHLVVSVRAGRAVDAAGYRFVDGAFVEARLGGLFGGRNTGCAGPRPAASGTLSP